MLMGTPLTTRAGFDIGRIYDNNYNNNNYSQLGVSCYPTSTSVDVGDTVTWRASVYGGNNDYNINWSGTNGLDGYGSSVTKRYNSSGSKSASVTVVSGGQTIRRNCGTTVDVYDYSRSNNDYNYNYNYNNDYNNYDYNNNNSNYSSDSSLYVSCSVNSTFAPVGTRVTWQAYVSGGNGTYRYEWYGTDSLRGSSKNVELFYNSPGSKSAYVIVRSGNKNVTQYCSNTVTVGVPNGAYNPYAVNQSYVAPTQTVVKYIEKAPSPTPSPTKVAANSTNAATLASLFSLENVPWGWVAILVIMVLLVTVIYLVYNEKKI